MLFRSAAAPPDAATSAAIQDAVPQLRRLSAERVWHELSRILAAPDPSQAVALMDTLGVLHAVVPEGASPSALIAILEALKSSGSLRAELVIIRRRSV